jgi:hypothetical protein
MIPGNIKNVDNQRKELRKFGLTIGIIIIALAGLCLRYGKSYYFHLFIFSILLILPAFLMPILLKPFHRVWMTIAFMMSWLMTRILLSIFFFLIITPIGILGRIFGKGFLELKFEKRADTYWIVKKAVKFDKKSYENQY